MAKLDTRCPNCEGVTIIQVPPEDGDENAIHLQGDDSYYVRYECKGCGERCDLILTVSAIEWDEDD